MSEKFARYFNLLKKDLLLSRNLLFLVLYLLVVTLFLPIIFGGNDVSTTLSFIISIIVFEMIGFGSQQVLTSEKCNGNELIITTKYTRKDIIYSRYLFFYLLSLVTSLGSFIIVAIFYPIMWLHFFNLLEYILLVFIGDAILIPLTFKIKNNLVFTMISVLLLMPYMLIIRNIGAIHKIMGFMSSCVLIFLLSIAITIISIKLSEIIYLNKNL